MPWCLRSRCLTGLSWSGFGRDLANTMAVLPAQVFPGACRLGKPAESRGSLRCKQTHCSYCTTLAVLTRARRCLPTVRRQFASKPGTFGGPRHTLGAVCRSTRAVLRRGSCWLLFSLRRLGCRTPLQCAMHHCWFRRATCRLCCSSVRLCTAPLPVRDSFAVNATARPGISAIEPT